MSWRGRLARLGFYGFCGAVLLYLVLPILVVVPMSFSSSRYLQFPPPGLSLRWYVNYLGDPEWTGATARSLMVATLVTAICTRGARSRGGTGSRCAPSTKNVWGM